MQEIPTFGLPAARERGGIAGVNGFVFRASLAQTDGLAVQEVDGGQQEHGCFANP